MFVWWHACTLGNLIPCVFVQVFYKAPLPKNATLGSSANFSCNVSGSGSTVFWHVNGTYYKEQTVLSRGVSYDHDYDDLSDSSKSILTIACDEQNNNTLVQCKGFLVDQLIESSVVVLRIQGALSLPQTVSARFETFISYVTLLHIKCLLLKLHFVDYSLIFLVF